MASQIAVIAPVGTSLLTGSPSLVPIKAALAWDSTSSSFVVGNGTVWAAPGEVPAPVVVTGITLTSSSGPSLTGCTLTIDQAGTGVGALKTMCLTINQTITTTAASGTWVSATGVIPAGYVPTINSLMPYVYVAGLSYVSTFEVFTNGSISLTIVAIGSTTLNNLQGSFV